MLPDRISRMLTAYVDGELRDDQRKAVLGLLRRSAKAREMLRHLQSDADCLRQLPRPVLGSDVSAQVVQMLGGSNVVPTRPRLWASKPELPAWLGLATAAAVLLVVGIGSYVYLSVLHQGDDTLPIAAAPEDRLAEIMPVAEDLDGMRIAEQTPDPFDHMPRIGPTLPSKEDKQSPPATAIAKASPPPPTLPATPGKEAPLGSPIRESSKFRDAEVDVALIRHLRELDQDKPRRELTEELRKGRARRMDLNCQEVSAALGRVQVAFERQGFRLLVDGDADNRLKLHLKADYALYVDSVSPEEFLAVMLQLRSDDREEVKRRGALQFEGFVLTSMNPEDHRNLVRLLGSDPTVSEQPAIAPKGQGGPPPAPKLDRMALVIAYDLERSGLGSPEVKRFLESRQDRRPGTMPMLLVLKKNKG